MEQCTFVEAIDALQSNADPEAGKRIGQLLRKDEFLVPVINMAVDFQPDAITVLEEEESASLKLMKDEDGNYWVPVFSGADAM